MGESKRRKQLLGSRYGLPLGLSHLERINLIEQNIESWISEHFDNFEYHNYLENPGSPQIRNSSQDFGKVIKNASQHFSQTFPKYPEVSIKLILKAILKDRPILFEGISLRQGFEVEPKIALPLARQYFRKQIQSRKIELSTHQVLVKEALIVLGREISSPLLERLLWGEINEVVVSAQQEKSFWLIKNTNSDGWIDLNEEVLFQSVNQAMAGILTMVATLPWSMQIEFVL